MNGRGRSGFLGGLRGGGLMGSLAGSLALLLVGTVAALGQMPLTLFNGTSLTGWNPHGAWTGTGGVLASNGGGSRQLLSAVPFGDFTLLFDYNESAPMGAKLRLGASREGKGGSVVDLDVSGALARVGGVEGSGPSPLASTGMGWHNVQVESTQGRIAVRFDGTPAGSSAGTGAHGGYLGWELNGNGSFQVKNVRLVPHGLLPAFNGNDLSGWKNVAHDPASNGGLGHTVTRTLTFGLGGGSTKPHSAKWTVKGGAMHGEDGPGGLEYALPVDDAILEVTAQVKGSVKPDHFTGVGLRDQAGKLGGGYLVGVGPYSGSIEDQAKRPLGKDNSKVQETIVIGGRTIAVWVNGMLVTVNTDSRPESDRVTQGARTSAGALTLVLPSDAQMDVQQIAMAPLAKDGGAAMASVAPPMPLAPAAAGAGMPAPVASAGTSATETALLQQQQAAARQQQDDRAAKQRVAGLMAQALATPDPQQQMALYNQVVQIDPSNAPAVQGFKDAQSKVQAAQAAQAAAIAQQTTQVQQTQTRDQQVSGSLLKAQSAFLGGHLAEASAALATAERLAPENPLVRDLRSRINATSSLHTRLLYLGGGAGLLGLLGLAAVWFRRRRMERFPMLEMTQGLDTGTQYPLDKDTVRIGAVAQDGGQKNDIVIRDVEHAVSRFHCEITRQNGQLYLRDLSSSNGTRVDGQTLPPGQPALLRKGNRILLANTVELRFGYAGRAARA